MNPAKTKASTNGNGRKLLFVTATLIMECFLVGMAQIEQLQRALKELIDLFFADLVRGQKRPQVEIGESAIGDASREKFAQAARIDGAKVTNLFKDYAAQGVVRSVGV